jgi:glycine/sarcosine/betaine reductase complex component A
MDLDDQANIQQVVDRVGSDDLVVLLGSPNPESAELYAATVTMGDPTFAGPLAGIPLGLPVYHVLEPEVVDKLSPGTYAQQLAMAALTLDIEPILETVQRIRRELTSIDEGSAP